MKTETQNGEGQSTETKPAEKQELTLNSAADISAQIDKLRRAEVNGTVQRGFTMSGFKTTACLNGMASPVLAIMAAACLRQIAVNDPKEAPRLNKLLGEYGRNVATEVELEKKLDHFTEVATDLGIKRNENETAGDFINRVKEGFSKSPQAGKR